MTQFEDVDYSQRHADFEHWFQTPLGRGLLADQRACVDASIAPLTGARQLQIGVSHRLPLGTCSDFSQRIMTTPRWHSHLPDGVVVCDADELPFPGDSMDLVILHHGADFSAYPHQVLRECSRVLRGGGQMLILGFNPLSLWGVRKFVLRHTFGPWGGRFLLRSRMEDWLRLLDFQVESVHSRFFTLPVQGAARMNNPARRRIPGARFLPGGAYYCILATKQVCSPIKRRQVWRRKRVIGLPGGGSLGVSRGYRQVISGKEGGNGNGE
ncbi:class I SAM-dependent methyltransferase [Marinobacter sp.]|uniref:class I SAM-dependent methyltransferase n=1 Tax=Marinobacter sp. TaxID=50741 RepID=UPI00384D0A60